MAEDRKAAGTARNIHTPLSLQELFGIWQRFPDAAPWAGGTDLGSGNFSASFLTVPQNTISLDRLDELRRITRTERYLEIGAMVRLNEITRLGKIIPDVLIRTLIGAASYPLRNLVTMGGLVCSSWSRLKESYGLDRPLEPSAESPPGDGDPSLEESAPEHPAETGARDTNGASRSPGSAASFIALDARFELRTAETSRWISASRFYSPGGSSLLGGGNSGEQEKPAPPVRRLRKKEAPEPGPRRELLTRVRIPLEQWNYSVYRKIQGESSSPEGGGTAVFIAKIEKETITDIRVIFASSRIIRSQAGETLLTGKLLPLAERDVSHFVELWQTALEEDGRTDGMLRAVLLNCIQACAQELA